MLVFEMMSSLKTFLMAEFLEPPDTFMMLQHFAKPEIALSED